MVVWTPIEVKTALESLATTTNQSLSATATAVLSAALNTTTPNQTTTTPNRNASNDADATLDMFGNPATMDYTGRDEPATTSRVIQSDKEALMNEVGEMLDEGLSGGEVARRLNSAGRRTANGAEFVGANLLRDYRKWQQRNEK